MRKSPLKNQSGQLVVEAVLLMALGLAIAATVSSYFQEKQLVQNLVAGPWSRLSGMIECGTWNSCTPSNGGMHPSTRNRNLSFDPEGSP